MKKSWILWFGHTKTMQKPSENFCMSCLSFHHFYPNLRIPEEQLLEKQIQFSGIVLVENPEVWEFIASLWSILVPYSQYSGK